MRIQVAHDFNCNWCWIGVHQTRRLTQELGVTFEWLGYELYPDCLVWDDYPQPDHPADRPPTPSRIELAYLASNAPKPSPFTPDKMRSHNALQAVEFVKTLTDPTPFVEAMYQAYWKKGLVINDPHVLAEVAKPFVPSTDDLLQAVHERRFSHAIVQFDNGAYAKGVYNLPTFWIGGKKYAEQPYRNLEIAVTKALKQLC